MLQLVKYIHRNPVKAGLADNLTAYKWSSYKGYISGKVEWQWLYSAFVLSMLSQDKQAQKVKYKALMSLENSEEIESFYSKKNQLSILGGEKFRNKTEVIKEIRHKGQT